MSDHDDVMGELSLIKDQLSILDTMLKQLSKHVYPIPGYEHEAIIRAPVAPDDDNLEEVDLPPESAGCPHQHQKMHKGKVMCAKCDYIFPFQPGVIGKSITAEEAKRTWQANTKEPTL